MYFTDAIAAAANAAPQFGPAAAVVDGLEVHIDGDYLAYYASGNEETTPGEARTNALNLVEFFKNKIGAEKAIVHYTAAGCHKGERYLIATTKPYQGHRAGSSKPKNHGYLAEWIQGHEGPAFRAKTWTTREADDGIGACAHHGIGSKAGYIGIATADKDMRMLPGLHIDWKSGELTRVMPGDYDVVGKDGKQYGLKFFWLQMLMGDTADNIPGLEQYKHTNADGSFHSFKKCGEVTAGKMLLSAKTSQEAYDIVRYQFKQGYHTTEFAMDRFVEQAALLWMRLDTTATVADFFTHRGHSKLTPEFSAGITAAVERMVTRVNAARAQIDSFGSQGCTTTTTSPAG